MFKAVVRRPFDNGEALWRRELAAIDPAAAKLPASLQAAQRLQAHGKLDAAIDACRAAIESDPNQPKALRCLSLLLATTGRRAESREALARACALEAALLDASPEEQAAIAAYFVARETGEGDAPQAPAAYVRALFDRAAEDFDEHLTGRLEYRGPELLAEAVRHRLGERAQGLRVLDAGCGTGLAAAELRPLAIRLDGVDLSPAMIEKARARGLYDNLTVGEISAAMSSGGAYDLVFASDVLSYIGDLAPVLQACAEALAPGGLLAATVEAAESGNYSLGPSGRYRHSAEYLWRSLAGVGFEGVELREAVVRREAGRPVPSLLLVAGSVV